VSAPETKIAEIVGSGKRVLYAGDPASGVAGALRERGNDVVTTGAAELERDAAASAREGAFDAVVFAGVLERLRDPARALTASRSLVRPGGVVVAVIPNVAHGAVRLALLRGRFDYRQLGIADEPPVRFYTRASALRLFAECGLSAERVERTTAPVFGDSDLVPRVRRADFDEALVAEVLRDEDADTLQFIVCAVPLADADALALLRAEIAHLESVVHGLQSARARGGSGGDGVAERGVAVNAAAAPAERLAELELLRAERDALAERVAMLDDLLAVERATRLDVEDACDRIERVARSRFAAAREGELARLRARSAVVDLELRLARAAAQRVEPPARRPPPSAPLASADVPAFLRGRRTLVVLPREEARAPLRSRVRRLLARLRLLR
jgi:SAM-dependent methyltransferase